MKWKFGPSIPDNSNRKRLCIMSGVNLSETMFINYFVSAWQAIIAQRTINTNIFNEKGL